MNDDRDWILGRVNSALAPLKQRAPLPEFDTELAVLRRVLAGRDTLTAFTERLGALHGNVFTSPAAVAARLRAGGWLHGYCDPTLWPELAGEFGDGFTVESAFDRRRVDDYAFGITRAAGAVAESGTLILNDQTTSSRLAALAPWVHVAVLRRSQIFSDLPQAVAALGADPNVIWCTGPSRTADVEGILIEGVHGPGRQFALVLPDAVPATPHA
jgi:L-lactate dehydrogenase complex protein LldG